MQVAHVADDGTQMVEVAPWQYVNLCHYHRMGHVWDRLDHDTQVCRRCGRQRFMPLKDK